MARGPKSYLRLAVIASPVIQQEMENSVETHCYMRVSGSRVVLGFWAEFSHSRRVNYYTGHYSCVCRPLSADNLNHTLCTAPREQCVKFLLCLFVSVCRPHNSRYGCLTSVMANEEATMYVFCWSFCFALSTIVFEILGRAHFYNIIVYVVNVIWIL